MKAYTFLGKGLEKTIGLNLKSLSIIKSVLIFVSVHTSTSQILLILQLLYLMPCEV